MFSHQFRWTRPLLGLASLFCVIPSSAPAQMVTTGFPLVGVRSSFSEGIGFGGGGSRGFSSPFNNFGANGGLSGGFGINNGGVGARFGFNFAQGSSRSMISNTPVVTGMSGVPFTFQNNVQRPFVTSLIPNVGNAVPFQNLGAANTIRGRMLRGEFTMRDGKVIPAGGSRPAAKSDQPDTRITNRRPLVDTAPPTRAEREAQQNAAESEELLAIRKYLKQGQEAEAKGKHSVAKLYYQMAARRAEGELKREALASLTRVTD